MIESRGIPTTVIGLVRPHMEKSQPPRGVWTPFQLGRPLGEPGDAAFQKRVIVQALRLLERTDGPVILEDFAEDAPNWIDRPGWRSPVAVAVPVSPAHPAEWAAALAAEMALVQPCWERSRQRFAYPPGGGRDSTGVRCELKEAG